MKILGVSQIRFDTSFIVQISSREMKDLIGRYDEQRMTSGTEVAIISSLSRLESIDRQPEQRAKIATQLRAMAEIIEAIPPMVIHDEQPKEGGDA